MAPVRRAAVIGAGTMGPGIGAVLARAGIQVALHDVSSEALERARVGVRLAEEVLNRLDAPRSPGGSVRFSECPEDALEGVDFVCEAVPEKLELKREVYRDLERFTGTEAILASNTSGITITQIAGVCAHPERVVGMHWSNPPHLIPMIEIVPGERTAPQVVERAAELVRAFGYHPVVEREVPGFVENRILYAILRECLDLVDRGVIDSEGVDLCVRWGIGYKLAVIGPMQLLDMAGLDVYESVAGYLNRDLATSGEVSTAITERTAAGRLGMKTLGGIYDYTQEDVARKRTAWAAQLVAVRRALSATG
jgi:3-hydroxyacyl-CoA dehydrogenase